VKVVILYDPGAEDWTPEDVRSVMTAVSEIAVIFDAMGHDVRRLGVRHDMRWLQICRSADLVFNLCEGVHGKSEWEEHVVGTLEFAGVPFTGCGLWTLAACRRKAVANALLAHAGLPIPRWTLAQGTIDDDFPLPAIVKPAAEDASAGIDRGSVVTDRRGLRARTAAMTEQFDEVLVQQYVPGREFNVGFVGSRTLAIAEIDFAGMPEGAWPILTHRQVGPRIPGRPGQRPRVPGDHPAAPGRSAHSDGRDGLAGDAGDGVRPGGPARGRAGPALGARRESESRPQRRRRPVAHGAGGRLGLRGAGPPHCRGGAPRGAGRQGGA